MGKMAKPQRSNKHKKMKAVDPFYVGDRPVDRNAEHFNLKPKKSDEDDYMSRGEREFVKLKNDAAAGGLKKRRQKRKRHANEDDEDGDFIDNLAPTERGISRQPKSTPSFKRRKGEDETSFLYRVDRETQAVIGQAQFEAKYNLGDPVDPVLEAREKEALQTNEKNKLRLKEKKRKLKEHKVRKHQDRVGDFAALKDEVKFGEVVQQPPLLTTKPRKAAKIDASKVGAKKLLLHDLIVDKSQADGGDVALGGGAAVGANKPPVREVGKTIKRKRLAPEARDALDRERERTIAMYRALKSARLQRAAIDLNRTA